jgi:hypothetical protein
MQVLVGLAVALCALALLLIKQLFEKQAQLDAARAQLQQAHERSAAWGPSGRADEWGVEARRLSDLVDLEQAPERLADLQQRVRHLRAAFPPAPTVPGS